MDGLPPTWRSYDGWVYDEPFFTMNPFNPPSSFTPATFDILNGILTLFSISSSPPPPDDYVVIYQWRLKPSLVRDPDSSAWSMSDFDLIYDGGTGGLELFTGTVNDFQITL
jgi:hypothetical protein